MAIKYTSSEGSYIGYRVTGSGGRNIVYVPGAYSNLAIERYIPASVAWEKFLGQFGRLVTFDKRGTGVSDRTARPLNLDQQVVDVEAVRVASDSQDFVVCGLSQGAPLAVLYALAYPERVRALVLMEGVCCDAADPYKPLSDDNTLFDWTRTLAEFDADYEVWCKSRVRLIEPNCKPDDLDLSVEYMQATASPAAHRFIWCCLMGFDIRPMLRHITQPALVVHTTQDKLYPVEHGRYLAEHIPGAQYVELPSDSHMPMYDQSVAPQLFDAISRFIEKLPDTSAAELSERFVSTILFTDIVSSTDQQRTHGDSVWTKRISEFEERSAAIVKSCRGRLAGSTGDGIFASFEVPGDG